MNIDGELLKKEFLEYAEEKITRELIGFSNNTLDKNKAKEIAHELVLSIDWENSALMHKGFCWIAKNYIENMYHS